MLNIGNNNKAEATEENYIISESEKLTAQTAGTCIEKTNSEFSEIDPREFDDVCNVEILSTVSQKISSGALKPQNLFSIMINDDGASGIYAKRVAHAGGKSQIALVFCFKEGNCSEDVLIDNSDLFTVVSGDMNNEATAEMKKDAKKALTKIRKKMLDYWDGTMIFDEHSVISAVVANQSKLPIDNSQVPDIKMVYAKIVDKANEKKNDPVLADIFRRGFYAFPTYAFEEIADELQMKPKQLAEYLKRNNLLYLQESSIGYQCKVKFFNEYCYCVRTLREYQQDVTAVDDINIEDLL